MEPFVLALAAHGLIGGADVIVNHELIARIPAQAGTGPEERLHSARELIFALLFVAASSCCGKDGRRFFKTRTKRAHTQSARCGHTARNWKTAYCR